MAYSTQQSQTQQHQQSPQNQAATAIPVTSAIGITSSQQWNNQQNTRSAGQNNLNSLVHTPSPWDHRYNQSSTLYSSPTTHQVTYISLLDYAFLLPRNIYICE